MVPRVLVLRSAGSNCDEETGFAFEMVGGRADLVHINNVLRKKVRPEDYHILAVPGGFCYGDDISAGKILANELRYQLAETLLDFHRQGKLIIGICNGFQVLVKAGLLPSVDFQAPQQVTLTINNSRKYEDRWVYLSVDRSKCVFTKDMPDVIELPVAHTEGKFVAKDIGVLNALELNSQIVFQYTRPDGAKVAYPWNPNGSMNHIAGICDPSGRVLGLMPHPERHIDPTHHPRWTRRGLAEEGDGVAVFRNAVQYFLERKN